MKPVKTEHTTTTIKLRGGTDENDLPAYAQPDGHGGRVICSVWKPTDDEREAIAKGENLRLAVWASGMPPVAIELTDERVIEEE